MTGWHDVDITDWHWFAEKDKLDEFEMPKELTSNVKKSQKRKKRESRQSRNVTKRKAILCSVGERGSTGFVLGRKFIAPHGRPSVPVPLGGWEKEGALDGPYRSHHLHRTRGRRPAPTPTAHRRAAPWSRYRWLSVSTVGGVVGGARSGQT